MSAASAAASSPAGSAAAPTAVRSRRCVEQAPASDDARSGARRQGAKPGVVVPLASVETSAAARIGTGIAELDRVLGGGLVPGSLVLLGGEPGVGKSSLTAAMLGAIGARRPVLLVAGEESPEQVRLRAERLGATAGVGVLAETELETVCATIEATAPEVCVVDSIQTLWDEQLAAAPGSVAQVRESAARLQRLAKARNICIVLIGHVTKEGAVAGPRVLEHLVDVVLMFEGDALRSLRVLRAQKNRFGATDEIGLFEMSDRGLVSVTDASRLHDRADLDRPGSCTFVAMEGTRPLTIDVQALVAPSELAMPGGSRAASTATACRCCWPCSRATAASASASTTCSSTSPAACRVDEPAADLAVALALVSAARGVALGPVCAFGEIALTGRLRPVTQPERRLAEAARLGLEVAIVPEGAPDGPLRVRHAATRARGLRARARRPGRRARALLARAQRADGRAPTCAPSRDASIAWVEVGPEVVDVLQPDGQPQQALRHATVRLDARAALDQRLDAAEAGRVANEPHGLLAAPGRRPVGQLEGQDAACAVRHLAQRELVFGMVRQARVVHGLDGRDAPRAAARARRRSRPGAAAARAACAGRAAAARRDRARARRRSCAAPTRGARAGRRRAS